MDDPIRPDENKKSSLFGFNEPNKEEEKIESSEPTPIVEKKEVPAAIPLSNYAQRKEKHEKWTKWVWRLLIAGMASVFLLFTTLNFFGGLPDFEQLENPNSKLASEIISADGETLGRYFYENRVTVKFDEISDNVIQALVATEDERYYDHAGIDPEALGRVIVRTILGGNKSGGGGSTISQQLAKLLFTDNPSSNIFERGMQKLKEWIVAVKLEKSYTKQEIIAMYLNKFEFLYGAYGIKSASETYFKTTPDALTVEEAAMLVGMLKNPSYYNPHPKRSPERAKKRREVVLNQMMKAGYLDRVAYDSLRVKPCVVSDFERKDHTTGLAPYFREELKKEVKDILASIEKETGDTYDVHKDGLKIFTTIDTRYQRYAEEAVLEHIVKLQKEFFKHWKNKDPWTYKSDKTLDEDIDRRLSNLRRIVRTSPQYEALRQKYFVDVTGNFKKEYGIDLRDVDMDRMILADKKKSYLDSWKKSGYASDKQLSVYRKVLKNNEAWTQLKEDYDTFQDEVKKAFDEKAMRSVFSYNEVGYEDLELSMLDSIKYNRMFLQSGMMVVHPKTGNVLAWVGGTDFGQFKFDHVNSKVARQVGSTFKPIVYATAIEMKGFSPCHRVIDAPITFQKGTFNLLNDWSPKNANGKFTYKMLSLYEGLKQSKNTVSAYLMQELESAETVKEMAVNMGFAEDRIPAQPSICLGAADLSVFEMTGAYTTFANNGIYVKPLFINRIEDKNGNVLYEPEPYEKQIFREQTNYVMVDLLRNVVSGSRGFYELQSDVAGKTGTTNEHADGWFMGLTPELVVGTWVGGDDRWVRFRDLAHGQGGYMARPIFLNFLKKVEKDAEALNYTISKRFHQPSQMDIVMDCSQYRDNAFDDEVDEFGETFEDGEEDQDPTTRQPSEPLEEAPDSGGSFDEDF